MRMIDIIFKKRNGTVLSQEEIQFLIDGYVKGDIPDYQMSAWAMAVYFKGMNREETTNLTLSMAQSGEQLELSRFGRKFVDKHSTGGVGDKTTLIVGPIVAACGVAVAKMSGRGLGHTGGTIDKLCSIPGFQVELSREEFERQIEKIGLAVISQTGNIVPADKKLYALRDVTATVDSIPLIASSIMSKKIASGAQGIVLDVKFGSGAFMQTLDKAKELARAMVEIGRIAGRETIAVLSSMDQPLGLAVGNSVEVLEAIEVLKGKGNKDLVDLCIELATWMVLISGIISSEEQARLLVKEKLQNGEAWNKFLEFIVAQGGNKEAILNNQLPLASETVECQLDIEGFINSINAQKVGLAAMLLGAGRTTKTSPIDLGAGIILRKKRGDKVAKGESLATLYSSDRGKLIEGLSELKEAFMIGEKPPESINVVQQVIK